MNLIDSLNWRYATKKFDQSKKLTDDQVNTLAESLRLSASSFGLQPWKFIFISDEKLKQELLPQSWNQEQVVSCSHHIVFCGKKDFSSEDVKKYVQSISDIRKVPTQQLEGFEKMMTGFLNNKDEHQIKTWVKDQVYIALGSFLVTCAQMGIDSCPMEGIIQNEYDRILALEDQNLTTVVACPVGFRDSEDKYAELAKVRFPLEDIVIYK